MNELEDAFYSALGYYEKNFFVGAKRARCSPLKLNRAPARRSKKRNRIVGRFYDLSKVMEIVLNDYGELFRGVRLPEFTWSARKGRRVLGWHDGARNRVTVNNALDSPRVPPHVLEYVVFHEMLHAKHEVKHGRRRTVHTREFREDEKKFFLKREAEHWLQRKW